MSEIKNAHAELRREATALAGKNDDLTQRALFYTLLYLDSGKNYVFGLGATNTLLTFNEALKMNVPGFLLGIGKQIKRYLAAMVAATRAAFVRNYTTFYFTQRYGTHP